jgi:hypothetical protein
MFRVGALEKVPFAVYDYYVFVVCGKEREEHALWINEHFSQIVKYLDGNTAIVSGTSQRLQQEITKLLQQWSLDWDESEGFPAGSLYDLLRAGTTLVISQGDIRNTEKPLILIPLELAVAGVPNVKSEDVNEFMTQVFQSICTAAKEMKVEELVDQIGGYKVPLKTLNSGVIISSLKHVNDVVHLKPSLFGIGVNINALIERALKNYRVRRYP